MTPRVLEVYGVPAPQGSKTAMPRAGKVVLVEGGSTTGRRKHRAWREAVAWTANTSPPVDDNTAVAVQITFRLPRPKSRPKRETWVTVKPDLDKLIRATLDGLADGGLIVHDQRVAQVTADKRYAISGEPTGATITITELFA